MSPSDIKFFCGFVANQDNMENHNRLMKRVWEIEECLALNFVLEDVEIYCEKYFKETHLRTENGHYVTKMPIDPHFENKLV